MGKLIWEIQSINSDYIWIFEFKIDFTNLIQNLGINLKVETLDIPNNDFYLTYQLQLFLASFISLEREGGIKRKFLFFI